MNDELIEVVKYRGKKIEVYADDAGQCYYFIYKGVTYGCGTYNVDYISEIVYVVDKDLDKVFYIKPLDAHNPSAKVYNRHGIWYMDYKVYHEMVVTYGKLERWNKDIRINKKYITDEAKKIMRQIDDHINEIKAEEDECIRLF